MIRLTPATSMLILLAAACGDRPAGGSGGGGGTSITSKVKLRYHPPAGAVHRYALHQINKMKMEAGPMMGMGEQRLTLQMRLTQNVTGPVSGGTEVKVTFDSVQMEAPGIAPDVMARELDQLRGLVSTVLFDERAQVVRSDLGAAPGVAPELTSQMTTGVKAMAFTLPIEPVGPGDSWTVATELPVGQLPGASGAGASRTKLTVREIRVADADTTVYLDVETTFPGDPIGLTIAGQPATLKLSGSLTGDQVFSLTRGVVVSGAIKGTMKMNVTGGPMGRRGGMVLSSATETSMRLSP
jgi:hypothetical protein